MTNEVEQCQARLTAYGGAMAHPVSGTGQALTAPYLSWSPKGSDSK